MGWLQRVLARQWEGAGTLSAAAGKGLGLGSLVVDGRGDALTWVIREGTQQLSVVLVRDAWERRSDFQDALFMPNTCIPPWATPPSKRFTREYRMSMSILWACLACSCPDCLVAQRFECGFQPTLLPPSERPPESLTKPPNLHAVGDGISYLSNTHSFSCALVKINYFPLIHRYRA